MRRKDGRTTNGGVRPGAGRPPTSVPLSGPAIIYLRELTRRRLGRQEVTRAELGATIEAVLADYARQQPDPPIPSED